MKAFRCDRMEFGICAAVILFICGLFMSTSALPVAFVLGIAALATLCWARSQDIGWSGAYGLTVLLPLVGLGMLIAFAVCPRDMKRTTGKLDGLGWLLIPVYVVAFGLLVNVTQAMIAPPSQPYKAPKAVVAKAAAPTDEDFTWAKDIITIFCDRMQKEQRVNVTLEKVLANGDEAAAVKFANDLVDFDNAGTLEAFMTKVTDSYGRIYGSVDLASTAELEVKSQEKPKLEPVGSASDVPHVDPAVVDLIVKYETDWNASLREAGKVYPDALNQESELYLKAVELQHAAVSDPDHKANDRAQYGNCASYFITQAARALGLKPAASITALEEQNQSLSTELERSKAEIARLRQEAQGERSVAEKAKQDAYDANELARQNYNAAVAAQQQAAQAPPQVVYVERPVIVPAPPVPRSRNLITHPTGYEVPGYKDSATQLQEFINQGEQLKIDNAINAIERKLR